MVLSLFLYRVSLDPKDQYIESLPNRFFSISTPIDISSRGDFTEDLDIVSLTREIEMIVRGYYEDAVLEGLSFGKRAKDGTFVYDEIIGFDFYATNNMSTLEKEDLESGMRYLSISVIVNMEKSAIVTFYCMTVSNSPEDIPNSMKMFKAWPLTHEEALRLAFENVTAPIRAIGFDTVNDYALSKSYWFIHIIMKDDRYIDFLVDPYTKEVIPKSRTY